MDITLIAIAIFILIAVAFLLIFLFKSIKTKSFTAVDGSVFDTQSDLEVYQKLYDQTKPLFNVEENNAGTQPILGFQKTFLVMLTNQGFPDLKTLIKYRTQLKALSDLINT